MTADVASEQVAAALAAAGAETQLISAVVVADEPAGPAGPGERGGLTAPPRPAAPAQRPDPARPAPAQRPARPAPAAPPAQRPAPAAPSVPAEAETQVFSAVLIRELAGPTTVAELCQEFAAVCESAVDPLEIASALEFDGIGDAAAAERYGLPDVFALADVMYRQVPRRPAEPDPEPDPWQSSRLRPALHGMLYGLPAVIFPAAAGLLAGLGVIPVLIVALLSSWSLSQGLAYLGYRRLGQAGPRGAQRVLLAGLAIALAVEALGVTATGLLVHAQASVVLFGVGEGAYMLGACTMLVLGIEPLLLIALAPGVLGSAAFIAAGRPPAFDHLAWAALAATPALALVLAAVCTTRDSTRGRHAAGPGAAPDAQRLFRAAELRGMLPTAAFGLVAAGLLTFPVAAGPDGHGGISFGALLAALPLSLSMGAAEWSLLWYRRRMRRLLGGLADIQAFAGQARLLLAAALLQYLAGAAALLALAVEIATATRLVTVSPAVLPELAVYFMLGGAMFLAMLLQALGDRGFALVTAMAALAAELAWRHLGVPAQLTACTGLFIVIGAYATWQLGSAVRHAF